jgi:sugar phosphate isomerase/epimerase
MQFGASTFIWESPFGDDKLHLGQRVAGLGFGTLEICIEDPVRVSADAVRRAAAEAGVTIAVCGAFGSDRDVSHEEPSRRRLGIDYLNSCIDLAAVVGAPGSGHVKWDGVFAAFAETGYGGLGVIESLTPEIQEIARAVSTWRPVAQSGDALAREGLTFLKQKAAAHA